MNDNKTPRRRRAFADFKENQYDDSFSLSKKESAKKNTAFILKRVAMVVLTIVFIFAGFLLTDALMDISEEPYEDGRTYTAQNTTTSTSAQTVSQKLEEGTSEGEDVTNEDGENSDGEEGEDRTQQENTSEEETQAEAETEEETEEQTDGE